jgi:3-oxoacyl-[acyl-carrier protein] reductase
MIVVISGATGGIGAEVVKKFASKGYSIVLLGRDLEKLSNLSYFIGKNYKVNVWHYLCNIMDKDSVDLCIENINKIEEKINLLINIAGVFPYGPIMDVNMGTYNDCLDVNLKLPFMLSTGLFDSLKKNGGGKIINIGSSSSYAGFKNTVIYCASKHAILGFSRALHDEWKDYGVTVHCISPGTVDTDMANILAQDRSTYIKTEEFSELVYDINRYSGNMLIEEVRAIRRNIK